MYIIRCACILHFFAVAMTIAIPVKWGTVNAKYPLIGFSWIFSWPMTQNIYHWECIYHLKKKPSASQKRMNQKISI